MKRNITRNMLIGALAVAGAAYLYKRYRNGGAEEVKQISRKAKHHLTNIFSKAKEMQTATA